MVKYSPLRHLWLAAVLLTRLPLPQLSPQAFAQGPQAVWAYPLIGLCIGATGAIAGIAAGALGIAALGTAVVALAVMVLLTGAMHEDGLADLADGFWGGFTPTRRLEIMRDSQIGTYGVMALVLVSGARIGAIAQLLSMSPMMLVAAAALSRAVMPLIMYALPHARADGLSQSVGRPSFAGAALSLGVGAIITLAVAGLAALPLIAVAIAVAALVGFLAKRKINGQTGDVLGATQQLSEAATLLACTALF